MEAMSRMMSVRDVWLVEYKSLNPARTGKVMARWAPTEAEALAIVKALDDAHYHCAVRLASADFAIRKPRFFRLRQWFYDARWRSRVSRRVE